MKILVVGSGAREHALCWALARSPLTTDLLCTPGNPGTNDVARNLPYAATDLDRIVAAAQELNVDLVVVGPEAPLALGLADRLRSVGVAVFGPSQAATQIESSKYWAKQIMTRAGVPTARCIGTTDHAQAVAALDEFGFPVVIKADGLAAGKGVVVAGSRPEAELALRSFMRDRSLGDAGALCLIEEFLDGTEVSVFALCDGVHSRMFAAACDYKRVGDGDTGPNTGGMGAYAPPGRATPDVLDEVMRTIIEPTAAEMRRAGAPMSGVFFAGLMLTSRGPKVLEFNARFGDPETQVILPLLESDLVDLLYRTATGDLGNAAPVAMRSGAAVGVVLASGGYPGDYATGQPIEGLDDHVPFTEVFQAGTKRNDRGQIVTNGGRVLTVTGIGRDLATARARAYERVGHISFEGMHVRSDIGLRELASAQ